MHSQYVGYTFIIDLMPNTGLQGFIIKEVLNLRLEGAPIFFISLICGFQEIWRPKTRVRNSFKIMSVGSRLFVKTCSVLISITLYFFFLSLL